MDQAVKATGLAAPTRTICCYPVEPGFIAAYAELLREALNKFASGEKPRILFSAHGLPKSVVDAGDPYQQQVEASCRAIVEVLGVEGLDWVTCYQSRVGPLEWIGPATDKEIERAGHESKSLIVLPIAFVSEHSETLVELDIEYGHLAKNAGVPRYERVPAVGTHPRFIAGLGNLVRTVMKSSDRLLCPEEAAGRPCGEEAR